MRSSVYRSLPPQGEGVIALGLVEFPLDSGLASLKTSGELRGLRI